MPSPERHEPFSGNRDKLESNGRAAHDEFFIAQENGPVKKVLCGKLKIIGKEFNVLLEVAHGLAKD